MHDPFATISSLQILMADADHIDVKQFTSEKSLAAFLASMFSYNPRWVKALYGVRWLFVRMLGMKQDGLPGDVTLTPEAIPFEAGASAGFFVVESAETDRYWIASAKERHLHAYIAVVCDRSGAKQIMHVLTIVHYQKWTGPVYFNVIRPFHHLVVEQMGRAGAAPYAGMAAA